jgi:hypothetical protein
MYSLGQKNLQQKENMSKFLQIRGSWFQLLTSIQEVCGYYSKRTHFENWYFGTSTRRDQSPTNRSVRKNKLTKPRKEIKTKKEENTNFYPRSKSQGKSLKSALKKLTCLRWINSGQR